MSVVVPAILTLCAVALTFFGSGFRTFFVCALTYSALAWPPSRFALGARQLMTWTLPIVVPLSIIHGIVNPVFPVGQVLLGIPIRPDGLVYSLDVVGRLLVVAVTALAWREPSNVQLLALAQALRLPKSLVLGVVGAASASALVESRVTAVVIAQRARGLEMGPGIRARVRALFVIAIPIITTTIVEAHHRGTVVSLRGLGHGELSRNGRVTFGAVDLARAIMIGLVTVVALSS